MAATIPEPPPEATARARAAAVAAVPGPWTRTARSARRTVGWVAAAAGVAVVATLLAVLLIAGPEGPAASPTQAAASLRPDVAGLGPVRRCARPVGMLAPCVAAAQKARRSDPALSGAPWLDGAAGGGRATLDGSTRRPSLVFPPGTTYGQAVDALYVSAVLTGRLPRGTALGPPLPDGVVLLRPANPADGIAIDLRAPFGWQTSGRRVIAGALLTASAPATGDRSTVWPPGTSIAVPDLPGCMVRRTRGGPPARCSADDQVRVGRGDPPVPPLPSVLWDSRADAGLLTPPAARPQGPLDALDLAVLDPGESARRAGDPATVRGRVLVVAFLASWCEPCGPTADEVEKVRAADGGAADVTVLGVAARDLPAEARAFRRRHETRFATLLDADGRAQDAFGVTGLPEVLLIDARGRIAARVRGELPGFEALSTAIDALRAEAGGRP